MSDDDHDDDMPEPLATDPAERLAHEHWPAEVKEQAAALLFAGRGLRATARQLGVPYTTLRDWRISDDPVADDLRKQRMSELIETSWEAAFGMIQKIKDAPVRSAQEAAVAYGILVERSIMMTNSATVVTANSGKGTLADWMKLVRLEKERVDGLKAKALPGQN